eukprot:CAMPEP_0182418982 /NCGR_PEP_ID=MMETSP1167-20130531/3359_1 /TAXON_ID=2988 /ORGANISM="Mallomonas Sp, Strain CCMP3275" /LENGTH=289 /DNA_ID=CAMNT_0024593505 /DNA_START=82 /DNA_END=951 /DNA_ORIENTATION=-
MLCVVPECDDDDTTSHQSFLDVYEKTKFRYNTTGMKFAGHTITNPDVEEIFLCLAAVLQAQICEDGNQICDDGSSASHVEFMAFDVIPELKPEFGGPIINPSEHVLDSEDEVLNQKILAGAAPTIDTIYRYFNLIYRAAHYSPECNIIALIYINRICTITKMPLTMRNWRAVWLVTIMLAQKVWDDQPLKTSSFSTIMPSFTVAVLRRMESSCLSLLRYGAGVKPSVYAKYYFELRTLFTEITGNSGREIPFKPFNQLQSMRIEAKSARADRRALTLEDFTRKDTVRFG